jgi:putative peptidoglycan lipid II flippase
VLALAIAGSIGAWCNVALLYAILARRGYFRLPPRIAGRIVRIAIAALAMGAALWLLMDPLDPWFDGTVLERTGGIAAVTLTGSAVYGIAAFLLGVLDRDTIARLLRRQT